MISIVVPAHNEARVIGRMLGCLLAGARPGEIEVVVVANGCSDATADIVRAFAQVRLVETPVAAKHHALNLGDAHSHGFPRFYLDADVEIDIEAVRRMADVLARGDAAMAAPRLCLASDETSWAVQAFHRVWLAQPYARSGLAGTGAYALSEQGRLRFREFPPITGDDAFVRSQFAAHERRSVDGAKVVVHGPRTLRDVVKRRVRVYTGNAELRAYAGRHALAESRTTIRVWPKAAKEDPTQIPAIFLYLAVCTLAKVLAWRRIRRGDLTIWDRDESSRVGTPG